MEARPFFEQQDGNLCAQHALNATLQGPYYTAVDMAEIARELDAREELQLGHKSEQSSNYDDSGFFSLSVVEMALQNWNLRLLRWGSDEAGDMGSQPEQETAFICNRQEHWFTLRKIFGQWYDLNSTLERPTKVTDTYLGMYLAQLVRNGYSVFAVRGDFPTPQLVQSEERGEDADLAKAIAMSLKEAVPAATAQQAQRSPSTSDPNLDTAPKQLSAEEIRRRRLARFASADSA